MSVYCTKCSLHLTSFTNDKRHKVICLSGCGSKTAKIMLIGEAPGNDELFKKEPFVGKAGKELDKCLKEVGINRADIFLSNSVRCRPPENRDPNAKELKACREFLVNEINTIKPNVIGLLGNIAMKQVLGKTGSLKYQGQPFWSDEFQVTCIPLIHPSYIIRNQDNMEIREKFIDALKFVKEASKTKNPIKRKVSPVKYVVCDNMKKVKALFSRLSQVREVAIDTESTCLRPYNGKLICISFSWKNNTAIVLPILDRNLKRCWNNSQYSWILKKFGELTSRKGIKKIFQNGKHDIQWFKYHLGIGVGINFDTKLAHYVLNQSAQRSSHGLKEMAWTYTDMGNYAENIDASKFGDPIYVKEHYDDIMQYACADADCTFRIYRKLFPHIKKEKMEFVLYKIMLPQSTVLASIELNGVQIDRQKLEQLKVRYGNDLKKTETKLYEIPEIKSVTNKQYKVAIDKQKKKYQDSKIIKKRSSLKEYLDKVDKPKFNFNSHQQLADLFYRALKMPKPEKTKKGTALSTDKKTLEKLKDKHLIIKLILEYKKLTKMYNTYICPTLEGLDENDRIHTEYNQHITATGRLSSSKPNLQNVPKEYGKDFRDCFIAKKGCKLLSADSKQIEFRVLAHLSADQRMIADIKSGKDIHTITASRLYRVEEEDVTKEQRDKSKPFVFGVPYGRGAKAISEQYGITIEEAEEQLRYFNQIYPRASRWNRAAIIGARKHRYVKNWFGRKRTLPFINDRNNELREKEERKVVATAVQGTASDIVGLQMIEVYKKQKKANSKSKIVLTIHDNIVLEVPDKKIDTVSDTIKEEMSKAPEGFKVPLDVDIKIGERWGSMVESDKFEED